MADSLLEKMLAAALAKAGASWGVIKDDVETFSQNLIDDSAQITADLARGAIEKADADIQFQMLADYSAIVANYVSDAVKAAAQAAYNAAVDTLWTAIEAVAKV